MRQVRNYLNGAIAFSLALAAGMPAKAQTSRPPQYVLLAFDGSKENAMWEETRRFSKAANAKLTYFISGVYFLTEENKMQYHAPAGKGQGRSDIGFGGSRADLERRLDEVLMAKEEGHELASHANGHFDGTKWTAADWTQEFSEFTRLLENVHENNKLSESGARNWQDQIKDAFIGFRAPLLGAGKGLWEILKKDKFIYDTSRTSAPSEWPKKTAEGFWNFPLATLTIAGTAKRTLSMDFNFYYADSGGKPDLANAAKYEERMYKTYIDYFTKNYYGNRAPIHIGHHFSRWNNGAYLKAFEKFGNTVCGLPEVKCVTYQELAKFMDAQDPQTLEAWQKGLFPKFDQRPLAEVDTQTKDVSLAMSGMQSDQVKVDVVGKDVEELLASGYNLKFAVNGKETAVPMAVSSRRDRAHVNVAPLWKGKPFVLSTSLRDAKGDEIQRADHLILMTDTGYSVVPKDLNEAMRLTADPAEAHDE